MTDNTNTNSNESVTPSDESVTNQSASTSEEMVPKSELDKVIYESIQRKKEIKQLNEKIEALTTSVEKGKPNSLQEEMEDLKNQLALKDQEINKREARILDMTYRGKIAEMLGDVTTPRAVDIALEDAKAADELDDELLPSFINKWKKDNPAFIKKDPEPSPAGHAGLKDKVRKPEAPGSIAPEDELDTWNQMTREEKLAAEKQHPGITKKMKQLQINKITEGVRNSF